ncbi:hypothetical protein AAG906_027955 [Vitis piasezkii]
MSMDSSVVFFSSWMILALLLALGTTAPQAHARAFFVFGDSLVDSGNNDYLVTTARADSPPYGIDYPTHRPTGRFSNGLNIPDIISEQIGEQPTLPYLSPELTGERLLVGANFASAGIGILNDTGIQFTERLVNQALVLITLGGNDFVNNYYLVPFSARSRQFSLPDYVRYLISEYRKVLRRLYELGARRVLVTGTGPMGCVPAELAMRSRNGECAVELQRAADLFNPQLVQMINGLNNEIGGDVFIAANAFRMHMDFISNPGAYGFVTSKIACCGQGPYNGLGLCTIASNLCANRDANRYIVRQILSGSTDYMHPMNLSNIMALDSRT